MEKKLYKSRTNKTFCGVLGGIGEYFDIDPTIIRLVFALATIMTLGITGIIAYIAMAIIIPEKAY